MNGCLERTWESRRKYSTKDTDIMLALERKKLSVLEEWQMKKK
jgi:hypothetical protein